MKEKNKVFLGENGITSTSANHIANIAKEYVQQLQNENAAIGFLDCKVSLITSQESKDVAYGIKPDALTKIPENLQKITKANSLIAWLREAIKAKEAEIESVSTLDIKDYLKAEKIDCLVCPDRKDYGFVEFDDILATLSIKEREEYYGLETKSAVIGKFIHPEGSFSQARNELQKKVLSPTTVHGVGQNAMIYEYTPSVETKVIEDMFFSLQNEHRSAQASFNAIKFRVQQEVDEINQRENNKLSVDTDAYNNNYKKLQIDFNAHKEKKRAELSKLKILIPNSLIDIFEILNKNR
jgi:uncharacterized protein YxeA